MLTIPLILFCDDTSGNKSKKWNKFIEWSMILAGISMECYYYIFRYHKSLVGRDFKTWAQVGLFIVWDFLTKTEQILWLSLAKV